MANNFVPLRIISGYSFLQSGLTIEKIVDSVNKHDFYGAGLSDYGVLYGVPSFIKALEKNKRKYLIGLSITLGCDFVIYALSEEGYHNLIKISALIDKEHLDEKFLLEHLDGTAVILETNHGQFKKEYAEEVTSELLHFLADLSGACNKFYLGLEVTNKDEFKVAQSIREFAKEHSYETIAFPRIKYQTKADKIILTIVNAIDKDEKIDIKQEEGPNYFMDYKDYQKIYTKRELDNTVKLVDESKFVFNQKRGAIVKYPVENAKETLKNNVLAGLKNKGIDDEAHLERANYELSVIFEMGYEDYFLIVSDYVNYAKNNGILVGPGRGSAAGSLVSYAIDITEVDPLKFDLSFERFLNKARKTMPDIDVDFMDIKRDDVIHYIQEKYGVEKVANIVTFQTIQAKQSLRDIGRIYNVSSHYIDMLSKSITDKMTLREAYKKLPTFRNLVDSDKYFLEIVSLASKIEFLPRQTGMHAAGIILNNGPLEEVVPVTSDFEDRHTTQYEAEYLEEQGFLKMDILSLTNLTTIDYCVKLVNQNHNLNLDMYHLPYEDENIYKLLASGQTAGIFQLESSGMKNAIKVMKPDSFEDIYTLLAIFRPGPMDNIKEYALRKSGKRKVTYLNAEIEKILKPTHGILVYQEQISAIASAMAGYSKEDADLFRRAVSHKEKSVLESSEKGFIEGSIKNGYQPKVAKQMFDDILKFANYGFNKSHAVVYAIIACRMAYLKYYYPLEFYVSILSTSSGASDAKFSEYVRELKNRKLNIYGPDINKSTTRFTIVEKGLLFPLNFIKGISELTASKIVDERLLNGEYKDFFDFVARTFQLKLGEAVIYKLISAGAFDKLYPSRATLHATLKYALQFAELSSGNDGQLIFLDTLESQKQYMREIDIPLDNLNAEYETLGIMVSDNPLRYKKDLLKDLKVTSLLDSKENNAHKLVGIISQVKTIKTRKSGKMMAFIKLFDETSELEVTVFPKLYESVYQLLVKNNIVVVEGRFESNEERDSFSADNLYLLEGE